MGDVSFIGNDGEDESRGWPKIDSLKQKKTFTVLQHTKKISIFMGSGGSGRRTPDRIAYRDDRRAERAEGGPCMGAAIQEKRQGQRQRSSKVNGSRFVNYPRWRGSAMIVFIELSAVAATNKII